MTHHDFFRDWNYQNWINENLNIDPDNDDLQNKKAEFNKLTAEGYVPMQINLLTDDKIQYMVEGIIPSHHQGMYAYGTNSGPVYAYIDVIYCIATGEIDANSRKVYKTPNGLKFVIVRTAGSPAACGTVKIYSPTW